MGFKGSAGAFLSGFSQSFAPFMQMKLQESATKDRLKEQLAKEKEMATFKGIAAGTLEPTPSSAKMGYKTQVDTQFDPNLMMPGYQQTMEQEKSPISYQGKYYQPTKTAEPWKPTTREEQITMFTEKEKIKAQYKPEEKKPATYRTPEYTSDLNSAINAIAGGANELTVYRRIAGKHPARSAELKRMLVKNKDLAELIETLIQTGR